MFERERERGKPDTHSLPSEKASTSSFQSFQNDVQVQIFVLPVLFVPIGSTSDPGLESSEFGLLDQYDWKVHVRLPGNGNSNSHASRLVHQIISTI